MKIEFALFAVFIAAIFVLGCIGGGEEEKTQEVVTETPKEEVIAEEKERPTYLCPLDTEKITYDCETDDDCKLVTCRSGAGDVDTCVGVGTDYEGVASTECICKVTGSYEYTAEDGTVTTAEIKECRHI